MPNPSAVGSVSSISKLWISIESWSKTMPFNDISRGSPTTTRSSWPPVFGWDSLPLIFPASRRISTSAIRLRRHHNWTTRFSNAIRTPGGSGTRPRQFQFFGSSPVETNCHQGTRPWWSPRTHGKVQRSKGATSNLGCCNKGHRDDDVNQFNLY